MEYDNEKFPILGACVSLAAAIRDRRVNGEGRKKYTGEFSIDARASAEAGLIVQMYFQGYSLTRIGEMINRPIEYVTRTFHSDDGRIEQAKYKRQRAELRDEIRDRATYAAQGALDEIIKLSSSGASEAVRRLASKDILDIAEVGPAQVVRGGTVVNIGDEALSRMCEVMRELTAPTVDAETLPLTQEVRVDNP